MTAQLIEISGEKMVMLPFADYQKLVDIAEARADETAFDDAERRRLAGEEYVPVELIDRMIAGEHPLKVWRQYRGMSLEQLAKASGTSKSFLSEIENRKRQGRPMLWRALAETLNVTIEDILPLADASE